jgi:hypothetical protein
MICAEVSKDQQDISEESYSKLANSNWVDKLTFKDDSVQFNYSGSSLVINQEVVLWSKRKDISLHLN